MKQLVLLGYPVDHSLSPLMHNAALKEMGLDDIYLYETQSTLVNELQSKVDAIREGSIEGANVTIPYKTEIMNYLDGISKEATDAGSVNTLRRVKGEVIGYNTDVSGFLTSLRENSVLPLGLRVIILGAGGAAKAISYALVKSGIVRLDIRNRTLTRAADLATKMRTHGACEVRIFKDKAELDFQETDLVVNCTPLGMNGKHIDESPIKSDVLHSELVVVDLVYNPRRTKLLMDAEQAGCRTIDGTGMLVNQGADALELWIGMRPPIDVMREAVLHALGG